MRVIPAKMMGFVCRTSGNQLVCADEATGVNSVSSVTPDNQETQDVEDLHPPVGR